MSITHRLTDLKREAEQFYGLSLHWTDSPRFGGSSWADVDHHTVSVMVEPPGQNPHIAQVWPGRSNPLPAAHEPEAPTLEQAVMQL